MKIQIPEPCHERWQDMNPTERGAFCLACQTDVQDFTKMSDAEIRQYFREASGKTCGRFRPDQLDRPLALEPKRGFSFSRLWLGIGLFLGWAGKAEAQEKHLTGDTIVVERRVLEEVEAKQTPPKDSVFTIKGRIIYGKQEEEVPGAAIFLKGTTKVTTSDGFGKFEFVVSLPVTLSFYMTGFETQEIMISEEPLKPLVIRLEEANILGGCIVERPNLWQRFKNLFRRRH